MSLPVIMRALAEADVVEIFGDLEFVRDGLGKRFLTRLRELLDRIEWMPEMFGIVWEDVRAAKLQKFRCAVYFVVSADHVEVVGGVARFAR